MGNEDNRTRLAPGRSDAVPDSYAIHVDDQSIEVWQYCVDLDEPDGSWQFVEGHDPEDDLRVSVDFATLTPPANNGYWVYSKAYDCEMDCN